MRPSIFVSTAAALLFATAAHGQTPASTLSDADYLKLGQQYSAWLFAGRGDSLEAHMVDQTRQASAGAAGIMDLKNQLDSHAGKELWVVDEKVTRRRGAPQYWRESQFATFGDESLVLRWVMNPQGQIVGIGLGPLSQAPAPDSTTAK